LADLDLVLADLAKGPGNESPDQLFDRVYAADKAGEVAYARHLEEAYLRIVPDNALTLLRYTSALKIYSQYEEAMQTLDTVDKVIPDQWKYLVHSFRADIHESRGDFDTAITEWAKADDLAATGGEHYAICQAWAAFRQGKVEEAIERIRKVMTRPNIDQKETLNDLGWFLLCLQRYEESRQCYEQLLALDPEDVNAKKKLRQIELILADEALPAHP
ncbi:MAG: Tetratricopeptide repeat, partial [Akkermansiaceae bacterium]|nr:Tetratricopeptide repeat [Akkermansiaceae bacterium]